MGISQHYPVIDPHLPPQFGHLPSQINLGLVSGIRLPTPDECLATLRLAGA